MLKLIFFFLKGVLPVNSSDVRLNNTKLQSVGKSKKVSTLHTASCYWFQNKIKSVLQTPRFVQKHCIQWGKCKILFLETETIFHQMTLFLYFVINRKTRASRNRNSPLIWRSCSPGNAVLALGLFNSASLRSESPAAEGEFRRHVVNRARWLVDGAEEPRAESMPYQNKMSHLFHRLH